MEKSFTDIFNDDTRKLKAENELCKYLLSELLKIIVNKRNITSTYNSVLSNELNEILIMFKEIENDKRRNL